MIHITYQGNIESKQFRQCWCQEIMDYTSGPYYEITWRVAWRVFSWCSSAAASFCFHFGSTISSPFRRSILSGSATNFRRMTQTYTEFLSVYNGFRSMQIKIFSKKSHNLYYKLLQTVRVHHVNSYFQTHRIWTEADQENPYLLKRQQLQSATFEKILNLLDWSCKPAPFCNSSTLHQYKHPKHCHRKRTGIHRHCKPGTVTASWFGLHRINIFSKSTWQHYNAWNPSKYHVDIAEKMNQKTTLRYLNPNPSLAPR